MLKPKKLVAAILTVSVTLVVSNVAVTQAPSNLTLGVYEILQPTTVYKEPHENSARVTRIEAGTRVNVVAVKGNWLEIRSKHGRPPGFIKKESARPITASSATLESGRPVAPGLPEEVGLLRNPSQKREARPLEECATPTRARNPPGYKYEMLDPKLAALYRNSRVSLNVQIDQRWSRAYLLQQQGLVDAAYAIFVNLLCEWPDAWSKSSILTFLSMNREAAGDLEAAIWFYEKNLDAEKMRGEGRVTGAHRALELLRTGEWYSRLGDKEKTRKKISEAETILSGLQAREAENTPEIYFTLAELYVEAGDLRRSREILNWLEERLVRQPASQRPSSAGKTDHEDRIAIGFAGVSAAYLNAGEYADAKKFAEKALTLARNLVDLVSMIAFSSLAEVNIADGRGDVALRYLREAEKAKSRYGEMVRASMERTRSKALPEVRAVDAEFDRAMTKSVNYAERAETAWLFGQAYALNGQRREAAAKFVESVEVIENLRGFVGFNDRLKFFGKYTGPYHSLVESLLILDQGRMGLSLKELEGRSRSPAESAFYYAEAARSRLLSEQIARSRTGSTEGRLPVDVLQKERELVDRATAELRSGVPFRESPAYREFQLFVEDLRKKYPDYATLRYPIPVTASEVPLKDKESLLAYSLLKTHVVIWLLQRGTETRVFRVPVERDRFLRTISSLRASLEIQGDGSLSPFDNKASAELYQWLLAEPLKSIPRGSRIVVIPDGPLGTIPFEVLTVRGPDGAFESVGQRYIFSYSPSATVLTFQRKIPSAGKSPVPKQRLLGVGDPVYNEADMRARKSSPSNESPFALARATALRDHSRSRGLGVFSRLPGTEREIKQVASALGVSPQSPDIRLGTEANEYDLKTLDISIYRYLHFATHGVLAEDLPYLRQPALVLSQVGDLKGEDGFLTMEEILNLKLNADLAVLSACQTGLGKEISGEGVVGLMRAFLYAGSRSVLVSLWRVEDESTAVLMGTFYQHVAQGLPFPEALRRAKQELRTHRSGRFSHPFYWAPFVLYDSD